MRPSRRSVIIALDALAVGLAILAVVIVRVGGMVFVVYGTRVSFSTAQRTLTWLTLVIILRTIIGRTIGPFGRLTSRWVHLLDSIGDDPLLVAAPPGYWRRVAFAALGMAAALAVLLQDQLLHMYSVPDLGDPLFSVWRIAWVSHQIVANPLHLFDANIFYPERLALTLSDPVILPALTIAPLLAIGVHPVVAYNVLFLSGFWLSGVATYLLVDRLTHSPRAAFIAGLMYACYSYRFEHYSHLELQMTQWMPLALLALHLFVSSGRWRYAWALGLAGVAQLYSSMYFATFFVVYAATIALGLQWIYRLPIRRLAAPLAVSAVLAALLAAPLVVAFTAAEPMKGARGRYEVVFYSAVPSDYLRAHRYSVLWNGRLQPPVPERTLFPGAAPLALAAMGVAPPLGAIRLVYAAGLLVSFDGSLGLKGVAYPFYYQLLAPFRGLRSPARFGALVGLTLSILAGFGARRALRWRPSPLYQQLVFAGLVAFVMIDALPKLSLVPVWREPPAIYDALKYSPNAVIAELPLPEDETGNIPFMYFSVWHWARMANGYSGFIPQSYHDFHAEMAHFPDDAGIDALRRRGVNYVSVNCGLSDPHCGELMETMRRDTRLRLTSNTRWMEHTVQLYEVPAP